MNSITKPTFDANKLATTVGANGLAAETVVSQPIIKIPVESMVEYEFDQTKFEEYLSLSPSRSSLSRKYKMISQLRKTYMPKKSQNEDSRLIVAEDFTRNTSAHNDSYLTHSTLKERIQKRRANAAHARALLQQRQEREKETVTKEPPKFCQVWIPKTRVVQNQHSEPAKTPYPQGGGSKRATPDITLDRSKATINYPENANKVLHSQKKTHSPKDIVIPGRIIRSHCSYARLVKAALSECDCFKREAIPRRVSVLSKPKPRHFRKRKSAAQDDEFLEVTINVADKKKSKRHSSDSNPDFSPGGKVNPRIAQRMSRLQLGAIRRRDYKRMQEGMSSEDEFSNTCSAIASDDTISSTGQTREVLTITSDQFAQMLQEALAKQREEIRAGMKTEMELAIQQMRENVADDSDPEVDEVIFADTPPNSNNAGGGLTHPPNNDIRGGSMAPLTGGGLTHSPQRPSNEDIDDDEKIKELEKKSTL
uniref:Uncharacterized protein n=1 Tax=Asparagus officinalis TaxID=4686 RepID=Q2XNZ5_ASPOF|nr:hypothetical protein 10.t00010 [Asparagus officinalis]